MNILIATPAFMEVGAKAPDLVGLSVGLAKRGHRVCVLSTTAQGSLSNEVMSDVTIIRHKPFLTIPLPYAICFPYRQVETLVKQFDIQLIHAVFEYAAIAATAAFFSRITHIPYVLDIQGAAGTSGKVVVDILKEVHDYTVARWIAKHSRMAIVLSESLKPRAFALGCHKDKIAVRSCGVDVDYFNPDLFSTDRTRQELDLGIDDFVIGFAGRLVRLKGLTYLLHAAKKIQQKIPKLHVLIVGDGPERSQIVDTAKSLEIPVTFAGWVNDLRPYYSAMDVFILPSLTEGLPNALLESMAMQRPIIATNVGGNKDLIKDGVNGYLIPPQNADLLARQILTLYENVDLRARMASLSRKKVQQSFTWDRIIDRVEKIYEKALLITG